MKSVLSLVVAAAVAPQVIAETSPITKVVQLLTDLETKVKGDGEAATKLYHEFAAWCEGRAANVGFEIKTGDSKVAELKATIDQTTATVTALSSKVDELGSSMATKEADLKDAEEIRAKEAADFAAEEKELTQIIDTLQRAINIIERELRKGGSALVQLKSASNLIEALGLMVQASVLNSADASRLTALVQSSQSSEDDDSELGAPAAAVYESKSGSIVNTLEDLLDKAQGQLSEARKRETTDLHNFEMLKQSLQDEIRFANKDFNEAKQGIAAASQTKAAAQGELEVTTKDLDGDIQTLHNLHHDCTEKARDFEAETASRAEELKALAQAKKIVTDSTGGAEQQTYGLAQVSLLQLGRTSLTSGTDLAHFEAVRFVRGLASKLHAPQLAQLAAKMAAVARTGAAAGQDPFAKVKGLLKDMVARLESEASSDASHKAYCDKELAEAHANKDDKTKSIQKLTTKINQMSARSAQLKTEVGTLQKELAELAQSQAQQDKQRAAENAAFVEAKANLEQGLQGVKLALKVLREYYGKSDKAHSAGEGAAGGIIGLLEVVEADFSKGLAEVIATEESAKADYDQDTKDNQLDRTSKEQDVKYKTQESTGLDKAVAEHSSDRSSVEAELDAILEYLAKLEEQCIAKAEPYAEIVARRAAEINGLKQALEILQGESLLQKASKHGALRGALRVHAHP